MKNKNIISNVNRYSHYLYQLANKSQDVHITRFLKKNNAEVVFEDEYHPNKYEHDYIASELSIILVSL